jgi:hypothetical protein
MQRSIQRLNITLGKLDQRHIRLGLVALTLALFVLGAGAPNTTGGGG